jgi:hypothetical protein
MNNNKDMTHGIAKENDKIVVDHPKTTPNYLALLTHNGIPLGHQERVR